MIRFLVIRSPCPSLQRRLPHMATSLKRHTMIVLFPAIPQSVLSVFFEPHIRPSDMVFAAGFGGYVVEGIGDPH
ncbi:MAG: hypothetical protein ABSB80_08815 [Methanoregula sp.]|uniref:hypothetical protein n=1 Tax=Methanoregula sp. TaxID=2052170 RepID=UPI003D13C05B